LRNGQKLLQKETQTLRQSAEDTSVSTFWMLVLEAIPPACFDQKQSQATSRCHMAHLLLVSINKKMAQWLSSEANKEFQQQL